MNEKDTAPPLITIGMCCYNSEDTIARAIKSALAQDWPHFELLIVDDCSTDGSVATAEKAIEGAQNARIIRHDKNRGVGGTRKTIVENAKSEFIAFFDDDDESLPERLRTQYEKILNFENRNKNAVVACYASGYRHYSNGYQLELEAIGSHPEIPHGEKLADYLLFYGKQPGWFYGSGTPTCALMTRKSTIDNVGNFDPSFRRLEDADLAIRIALAGGYFIGCPEKLFIQHATSAPDKSPEKELEGALALAQKHKTYLDKVGYYKYAIIWPKARFYHFKKQYLKMVLLLLSLAVCYPVKTIKHLLTTGPRRLAHESRMKEKDTPIT